MSRRIKLQRFQRDFEDFDLDNIYSITFKQTTVGDIILIFKEVGSNDDWSFPLTDSVVELIKTISRGYLDNIVGSIKFYGHDVNDYTWRRKDLDDFDYAYFHNMVTNKWIHDISDTEITLTNKKWYNPDYKETIKKDYKEWHRGEGLR